MNKNVIIAFLLGIIATMAIYQFFGENSKTKVVEQVDIKPISKDPKPKLDDEQKEEDLDLLDLPAADPPDDLVEAPNSINNTEFGNLPSADIPISSEQEKQLKEAEKYLALIQKRIWYRGKTFQGHITKLKKMPQKGNVQKMLNGLSEHNSIYYARGLKRSEYEFLTQRIEEDQTLYKFAEAVGIEWDLIVKYNKRDIRKVEGSIDANGNQVYDFVRDKDGKLPIMAFYRKRN